MTQLRREIGFKTMVFLAVNSIVGSGLFFLPSIGARYAGPASILSWIFIGLVAICMSFVFAELVSMYPRAGGVFEFATHAFGEFTSFMTGWISWLIANVTISMLIVGGIHYLLPSETLLVKMLIAFTILLFFNAVSYVGMKISKFLLLFFSFLTIFVPLTLIIFGIPHINLSNFFPFFVFPPSSVFLAMFLIYETFIGWEAITFFSEEVKDPEKTMPKAIILATIFIVTLCVTLVFVSLGVIHWSEFSNSDVPFTLLSQHIFGSSFFLNYLIFAIIIGSAASWVISTPRLLLGMARENLFLKSCEKIHWKYKTPYISIMFQALVSFFVIVIGLGSYLTILSLLLPFVIILYTIVLLTFIRLRLTKGIERPYRSPFGIEGAAFLIVFNILLLLFWLIREPTSMSNFIMCILLIFLGVPIYVLVKLQDRKFVEFLFDHISRIYNIFIHIWYGRKEMNKLLNGLKLKENYNILDYGCGAAVTNLIKLSERVKRGTIVAVDLSKKQLEYCVKKVKKTRIKNIILVKEGEEMVRFHDNTFDGILCIGVLSYQKDPLKLLKEFRRILKRGRRVSILEFGKTLFLSPIPPLRSKESIRELFKNAGFRNIRIEERKKLLTTYYFITAVK
ncbi:MAG TPA: amino acid permease [Candidatus Aenigmarchaeota archaeon]|nr:amino acid permease [Candidatus Aenigmarchaeota archaeon]